MMQFCRVKRGFSVSYWRGKGDVFLSVKEGIIIIGINMILRFQQVEEVSSGSLWPKKKDGVSRDKGRIWWFLLLRNKDIFPVGDRRKMWLLMIELG
jgi:hypothetical protein